MDSQSNLWEIHDATVIACRRCARLVSWREEVAATKRRAYRDQTYWGKPVPGFGNLTARVLVVGLAPGAHGANRTGRMFTGDGSGEFLYQALYTAGFANQPTATARDDGLQLRDLYISAVCRCVPPANKPTTAEIANCLPYLWTEIELLTRLQGIVVLGRIAFEQTLRLYRNAGAEISRLDFAHNKGFELGADLPWLLASYHPSRQNTQTGRLTEAMFAAVWQEVRRRLDLSV